MKKLLAVIMISNLMAILLQHLCIKLMQLSRAESGVATRPSRYILPSSGAATLTATGPSGESPAARSTRARRGSPMWRKRNATGSAPARRARFNSRSVMCCKAAASCRSAFTNSAPAGSKPDETAERYSVDLPAPLGPASK